MVQAIFNSQHAVDKDGRYLVCNACNQSSGFTKLQKIEWLGSSCAGVCADAVVHPVWLLFALKDVPTFLKMTSELDLSLRFLVEFMPLMAAEVSSTRTLALGDAAGPLLA